MDNLKPYWQQDGNKIYRGHILDVLPILPNESVHMCVTSPPYWGLRDYGLPPVIWDDPGDCQHVWGEWKEKHDVRSEKLTAGKSRTTDRYYGDDKTRRFNDNHQKHTAGQFCQLCGAWRGSYGLEPTPELYIKHTVDIFREVRRVLRSDGTLWLNMGDSYAGGGRGFGYGGKQDTNKGCDGMPRSIIPNNLKPKDLCGIPWRVALALQQDGWWLRSGIPWVKRSAMPESCTDRPASALEYVFQFTKSGTSQYWTHRDHDGTRKRPKADWRWINQIDETEVAEPPKDWKLKVVCPYCKGKGVATIGVSFEVMGVWTESYVEGKCPICNGKKKIRKWKRINLWKGYDYYFDMDAIKKQSSPDSHRRYARGRSNNHKWSDGGPGNQTIAKSMKHMIPGVTPKSAPTGSGIKANESFHAAIGDLVGSRNFRNTDLFFESLESPFGAIFADDELVGLDINPKGFAAAHFATFPPRLPEVAILAGSSERGCCPECQSPWERVVEKIDTGKTQKMADGWDAGSGGHGTIHRDGREQGESGKPIIKSKTTGWKPTCECIKKEHPGKELTGVNWLELIEMVAENHRPVPCTILDCFGGAMTTAVVAHKYGRKSIMIELSKKYIDEIGLPRIEQETKQRKIWN